MKQLQAKFARLGQMRGAKVGAALGTLVAATGAQAAIDTTAIMTVIGEVVAAVAVVGAAVLAMHYGIKAYRWLRAAG